MTRVYVDVGATAVDGEAGASDEDAVRALRYLVELGHEVTLVGDDPVGIPPEIRQLASVVAIVPSRPDGPAWYVTTNVEHCRGMSARVRTVLVGAAPAPGSVRRCDGVARDLQAAVMEILAAEAMQPSTGATL
ncbi:MAG: hypothetical protein FIA92_13070 [Chloroflexi bacterium]|nr:hypothetical protein [Chloroflexota bacterium]